jgi:glycosyltransferase involved in cell wall biosynthesis
VAAFDERNTGDLREGTGTERGLPLISVIIPCFNEEESLPILLDALREAEHGVPDARWEYLVVDDGSSDKTLRVAKERARDDPRLRYISFSRNFGKEAAMLAGMEHALGDYVCILDADMQDSPALLPQMVEIVSGGEFDCAAVRRATREGEPKLRSFFARRFYGLMGKMCDIEIVDGARDYRLMKRRMVDAVLSLRETNRYSKGIFSWVGFRTKWIDVPNSKRVRGKTKWSFFDLLFYAIDGLVSFSTKPLALSSVAGLILCAMSLLAIIFVIVRQLIWGGSAYGWPSLVCIILLLSGIQLFCVGILGQYLAKTFSEVKNRPSYIVREKSEETHDKD